jgi:ABC-type transport system involved in multi-copper enzyme maturation permease subunit
MRPSLGPVFIYECIANARRWQTYAARSFIVAALLAGMTAIAWTTGAVLNATSARRYERLGESYYYALIGVELALVMLAAPAATAGAICWDRSRGTLAHVLATDLSDSEIVLGKLAARLLPVLGLVACTWPVMALATLLGGVDPLVLTGAFAVIVAVGVLGCSLALLLSIWARRPHDVVVVVYTLWAIILLAYPLLWLLAKFRLVGRPPTWLLLADPFYLAYAPYWAPGWVGLSECVWFVAATLGSSGVFVLIAVWRMRPVSSRGTYEGKRARGLGWMGRINRWLPGPTLDGNPVLWRECRRARQSTWVAALMVMLLVTTTAACFYGAFSVWKYGTPAGRRTDAGVIAGILGEILQVLFGLLFLSAIAPLSLSEERRQGSLDVLVVTPLLSRSIVLAKWLGTFRLVPIVAIGPGLLMLALATAENHVRVAPRPGTVLVPGYLFLSQRLVAVALYVGTILAHGALFTSVGLALATWIKRPSRAIAMSVCLFVIVAVAWPVLVYVVNGKLDRSFENLAALSPIMTAAHMPDVLDQRVERSEFLGWVAFWEALVAYCALGLLSLLIRSFDACLGRTPDRIDRCPWMADVLAVIAGGIAVVCTAGAIALWAHGATLPSFTLNEVIVIISSMGVVMTGLLALPVIAAIDPPIERSTAWATILARWWRTFRLTLLLAVGPGVIAIALATLRSAADGASVPALPTKLLGLGASTLGYRLVIVALLVATILAHGAAITALSLALRIWTNRRAFAAALSAGLFLLAGVAWSFLLSSIGPDDPSSVPSPVVAGLSTMSFLWASSSLLAQVVTHQPHAVGIAEWSVVWVFLLTLFTIGALWRTSQMLGNAQMARALITRRRAWYARCFSLPHSTRSSPLPGD